MIVDRAYLEIDGETVDCSSINPKAAGNKKLVKVMNRTNRAKGHATGTPEFTLSVELPMDPDLSLDFKQMMVDEVEFTAVVEYRNGDIDSYLYCQIYDVDESSSDGEESTIKLEITALDYVKS